MRWNDFLFLITDDRDFRPQTCTNGLVFKECKHIKNIFEDVYFYRPHRPNVSKIRYIQESLGMFGPKILGLLNLNSSTFY
jgi:hypothetical protein